MLYLNEANLKEVGIPWKETISIIEDTVRCIGKSDYAQPIKPYLRYRDLKNRIIAMPAFVGADINIAGIKWIASFPDNIHKGIPRAHSVVVLNEPDTGEPAAVINTALLSVIRTASVSGVMMKYFDQVRAEKEYSIGIIGWGPIGRAHLKVCDSLFGERISKVYLYDSRPVIHKEEVEFSDKSKVIVAENWQEVYENSTIFITCTVSKETYIDLKPAAGSLLLNVSLRDFKTDIYDHVKNAIIVDDWSEVCREKTDIEVMHLEKGLTEEETKSIVDVVCGHCMQQLDKEDAVMFNPMGMAVFDVAIGAYYYRQALEKGVGTILE